MWGPVAPTKAFPLLEERVKQVARMLLQVGVTTLPKPVLHIVSGVAPLRQSVVQAVMQRWITTATLPHDSPARAALKAELDEWCSDPKSLQHASLWIHAALKILSEVDVAYAWWTSRQWSPTDPWKDVNVGATEVKSWRAGMVALLMGLDPAGKRWTDSKQQGALLTTLRKWYRHAALVLTIYNYWSEIEELKSLDDVKDLLQGNNPAPYSVLHRSPANDARSRMRGGIRGLLGYEERYKHLNKTVFETGQPPRRQCPLCKQPLSVPHLIRDCVALEVERRKTWTEASMSIRRTVSERVPTAATEIPPLLTPMDGALRHQWYLLTVGAEVSNEFSGIGIEGWHTRGWRERPRVTNLLVNPNHALYVTVLRITGVFVVSALRQLESAIDELPPTGNRVAMRTRTHKQHVA